jgi:hypothetical protein
MGLTTSTATPAFALDVFTLLPVRTYAVFNTSARTAATKARRPLVALAVGLATALVLLVPGSAAAEANIDFIVDCNPAIGLGPESTVDDTDYSRIKYTGFWKAEKPMQGQYMGTQHITNAGGSTASFTMNYAPYDFAFGFTKMRNAGKAAVYYNNTYVTTIDMYSPTTQTNCALQFYTGGVGTPGTFTVKALNQKNPSSGGTYVNVDYFYSQT